jgi:hypothetical protein
MAIFDDATLALLREARTIRIETSRGTGAPVHRTPIWIVVDDRRRALVRSVDGATARWYREATANPKVTLEAGGQRIPAHVEHAADAERAASCTQGYREKYGPSRSTDSMVRDEILDTTLELTPR